MLQRLMAGEVTMFGHALSWNIRKSRPAADARFDSPPYKLHLGPGPKWVKPSDKWLTVDVDPDRGDIVVDFHAFDGFPLPDDSVDCIYASHTFEHVSLFRIGKVMSECHRVLKPGGILRVIVPNPEVSIREYLAGNAEFPLFARRRARAMRARGEDLTLFECLREDFVSMNAQRSLLGESLAHQNAWDFDAMKAGLARSGFQPDKIRRADFQDIGSADFAFEGTYPSEANEFERSLYVEATK